MIKIILIYLLAINAVTFVIYGVDKRKAQKGNFRISEKVLLVLALAFGSIGALAGMNVFNHKTKKPKFIFGVPLILFIQVVLAAWLIMR